MTLQERTHEFTCARCGRNLVYTGTCTTGYGVTQDDQKHCYDCCADQDLEQMQENGLIYLYLDQKESTVSNWPGSLKFQTGAIRQGHHNIAYHQYTFWFYGPDGYVWWGRQFGDWTQLARCARTKRRTGYNAPNVGAYPYPYDNTATEGSA